MPRLRRKSPRRRLFFAGLSAAAPTPVQRPPVQEREPQFIKYEGSVFEPHSSEGGRYFDPFGITGIPGARVTIIGGQVDGWTAVTDREGRFTWQDYPECALDSAECRARRFRVEAAGYVTVEEGASDPHILWGPETPEYSTSEKHIPMSLEWPADPQIQRMLRELPAMSPLWLVERRERAGGAAYATGVIWTSRLEWSTMLAHEYCHAHQDWASDPDTYDVPPIDPLDDVLGTGLVGPQAYGGGTSLSVTRVLNRRFAAEIGVNHRTYPRIEVPVETGIRIRESRGSFEPTWSALLPIGPFVEPEVTSADTERDGRLREVAVTGALQVTFPPVGRAVRYASVGGGYVQVSGELPSSGVVGTYRFRICGEHLFEQVDAVTLRSASDGGTLGPPGADDAVSGMAVDSAVWPTGHGR